MDGGLYPLNNVGYTRDINPTLSGGTFSLVAQYSGDSSYQPNSSATTTLTVTPAATATIFYPGQTPSIATAGQQLGINVITSSSSLGVSPTGTYTVYDGTNVLATGQ